MTATVTSSTVPERKKCGRRPKNIDPTVVYKLAKLHCDIGEIAAFCDCHRDTIKDRFSKELEKGYGAGKRRLRRMQWKAAQGGNVVMQIWLGKQYLGQKDKQELTGEDGGPVSHVVRVVRE